MSYSRGRRGRGFHQAGKGLPGVERLESRELLSVSPHVEVPSGDHVHEQRLPFYMPPRINLTSQAEAFFAPGVSAPLDIAKNYLKAHADTLGLSTEDIDSAIVTNQYTDEHNGVTHIYLQQTYAGTRIANALINVNVAEDGRVLNAGSAFIGGLSAEVVQNDVKLDAREAIAAAGKALGLQGAITMLPSAAADAWGAASSYYAPTFSRDAISLEQQYVPRADGTLALSWNFRMRTPDSLHWYDASVDVRTGELNLAFDWVDHATYKVLAAPAESPAEAGRVVVVDPHHTEASPYGWHDTNGAPGAEFTDTRGNNVFAQEDDDANNTGGYRPSGGASLTFDFPFDTSQQPITYRDAAITNLFYWNNLLHDVHYQYGFDEVSGNFQMNNYGNGGEDGDPVMADAQDGSGRNNANMSSPPDGESPRMQQYIFDLTSPWRDSSLANQIIAHEFGHGVSNRLTGGPANANALDAWQSAGMGEGWSDFWALMFTQDPSDTKNAAYPQGNYVLGQPANGGGIREEPYSFDMSINNHTLGDYNDNSWLHDAGELWCSALWDMNWLLIDKYGYEPNLAAGYVGPGSAGNLLTMQLVTDGLKLQPANPSFTEARDAIVLADQVLTGGANAKEIWTAFARRGFGLSADVDDGDGPNSQFVVEAFDTPIFDLHVTASTPAQNAIVAPPPTQFALTFSQPFIAGTVDASDLQVNGIPATSVQIVNAQNLLFTFAASPVTAEGLQTMTMAEGALQRTLDGMGSLPFSRNFRYDTLRLEVTATTPADGTSVVLPLATIDVDFNEPIAPASVNAADLQLTSGTVAGAEVIDANTVRFQVSDLNTEGTLGYQFAAGAFTDAFGNPSLAYAGELELDFGVVPFSGEFAPVGPLGALGYQADGAGIIGTAGDVDTFTLAAEAGRLLTIDAASGAGWQPRVTVRDPQGEELLTVGGVGSGEVLVPELLLAESGLYSIEVSAPGGATGDFNFAVRLNVSREMETNGGPDNDTPGTAQPLEDAFVLPDGAPARAIVSGRIAAAGNAPNEIEPNGTSATATVLDENFILAPTNLYQLEITAAQGTSGDIDWFNLGTLQAGDVLTVSVSGDWSSRGSLEDPYLTLYQRNGGVPVEVLYDDDSGPGRDSLIYRFVIPETGEYLVEVDDFFQSETGSYKLGAFLETAGVAPATGGNVVSETESNSNPAQANNISASWRQVVRQSLTNGILTRSSDVDYFALNLTAGDLISINVRAEGLAPAILLAPSRGGAVATDEGDEFDRAGIYSLRVATGGTYYLRVTSTGGETPYTINIDLSSNTPPAAATGAPDYYSVELAEGESLSLAVDGEGSHPIGMTIEDADGTVLATGVAGAGTYDQGIESFVAPAAGTFYVALRGSFQKDYTLGVVRDAVLDFTPNDEQATAQSLPESGVALGELNGLDQDWFRVPMQIGTRLRFEVDAAVAGLSTPPNTLEPVLYLFNSTGGLMDYSLDGVVEFTANLADDYYVRLHVGSGAGDYILRVTELLTALPGDTNGDGRVDLDDVNNVRNGFGGTGPGDTAPFDGDVDLDDLNAVRNNFGLTLPSPEPSPFVAPSLAARPAASAVLDRRTTLLSEKASDALFALLGIPDTGARKTSRSRIG